MSSASAGKLAGGKRSSAEDSPVDGSPSAKSSKLDPPAPPGDAASPPPPPQMTLHELRTRLMGFTVAERLSSTSILLTREREVGEDAHADAAGDQRSKLPEEAVLTLEPVLGDDLRELLDSVPVKPKPLPPGTAGPERKGVITNGTLGGGGASSSAAAAPGGTAGKSLSDHGGGAAGDTCDQDIFDGVGEGNVEYSARHDLSREGGQNLGEINIGGSCPPRIEKMPSSLLY